MLDVKRRDFITLLCGAAVAWPVGARAQQPERIRRIGALMDTAENNPEGQAGFAVFRQTLRERNWVEGHSARIDTRWSLRTQGQAAEVIALAPDAILAVTNSQLRLVSL